MTIKTTTPTTRLGSAVHKRLTPKTEGIIMDKIIAAIAEYKLYIARGVPYSLAVMIRPHSLSTGLLIRQRLNTPQRERATLRGRSLHPFLRGQVTLNVVTSQLIRRST
jgi:hypothetical protein